MALGQAALAILAEGSKVAGAERPERRTWTFETGLDDGTHFKVRLVGPDLPSTLPDVLASPAEICGDPDWRWTYRLTVLPPIVSLDLCWRMDSGLRILVFSRGDWEASLSKLGGPGEP